MQAAGTHGCMPGRCDKHESSHACAYLIIHLQLLLERCQLTRVLPQLCFDCRGYDGFGGTLSNTSHCNAGAEAGRAVKRGTTACVARRADAHPPASERSVTLIMLRTALPCILFACRCKAWGLTDCECGHMAAAVG